MPRIEIYQDGSISKTYNYDELTKNKELLNFLKEFLATRFNSLDYLNTWDPDPDDHMILFFTDNDSPILRFVFQFKYINGIYYLYSVASPPAPYRIKGFARKSMINWLNTRRDRYVVLGLKIDDPDLERISTFYTGMGFTNPQLTRIVGPYHYEDVQIQLNRIPKTPLSMPKNESLIQAIVLLSKRTIR